MDTQAGVKATRREQDSIGEMDVPVDAYYGVQSLRAQRNFPITGQPMHPMFIRNLALVKKAAAITNRAAGSLDPEKAAAIIGALSLRTGGIQFIMITLAFGQMIYFFFTSAFGWLSR